MCGISIASSLLTQHLLCLSLRSCSKDAHSIQTLGYRPGSPRAWRLSASLGPRYSSTTARVAFSSLPPLYRCGANCKQQTPHVTSHITSSSIVSSSAATSCEERGEEEFHRATEGFYPIKIRPSQTRNDTFCGAGSGGRGSLDQFAHWHPERRDPEIGRAHV